MVRIKEATCSWKPTFSQAPYQVFYMQYHLLPGQYSYKMVIISSTIPIRKLKLKKKKRHILLTDWYKKKWDASPWLWNTKVTKIFFKLGSTHLYWLPATVTGVQWWLTILWRAQTRQSHASYSTGRRHYKLSVRFIHILAIGMADCKCDGGQRHREEWQSSPCPRGAYALAQKKANSTNNNFDHREDLRVSKRIR